MQTLPTSLSRRGWEQVSDFSDTTGIFIVKMRGYHTALFHVKDVDGFMSFFGGRHDTTIVCVESAFVMWKPEDSRKRGASVEDHFQYEDARLQLR